MAGSILGHPVRRVEDPRFLTGEARYAEDLVAEGALHAVFVRSFLAHGLIQGIDASGAEEADGVAGVVTAADLDLQPQAPPTGPELFARPVLARHKVRYVGEPVAVVVAESRAAAVDAAERVMVDYEPLPAVTDPVRALEDGAPLLFDEHGSNLAAELTFQDEEEDRFDEAEVIVKQRFVNQRVAAVPLEVNGALAMPDGDRVTLWASCQSPFMVKDEVCKALGIDGDQLDVVAPAVGGGFGAKIETYPEQIVMVALARRLRRPVRYTETRSENMTAMTQGRGQVQDVEIGAKMDGTIVALRAHIVVDLGAYVRDGALLPGLTNMMLSGVYRIPSIKCRASCVVTNATPTSAYRGAGRPEATALVERAVDMLARDLHMDPVEVRRKNFIPKDAFPYETATGTRYDSGDYEPTLAKALKVADYEQLREEQRRRRGDGSGTQLGIGVSTYAEVTGIIHGEFGAVEVGPEGEVTVRVGTSPHGQGHETAFSQIVATKLQVPLGSVRILHSDTRSIPRGKGTMGSRSLQFGGGALSGASDAVVDKAKRIAAHRLEVSVEDLVQFDGRIGVAGAPDQALTWSELASLASDRTALPEGMDPGLAAEEDFDPGSDSFPFGAHVSVVEVDTETGQVKVLRHVAVDDCGRIMNPLLVDGQVHGGIAQGMGQAVFEEVLYDDEGQPLTANLAMYRMASPAELPPFDVAHTETPTPLNPLGAKGIGEAATIGSTPAIQNAVVDALSHLGVRHIDMPLTPERVWRAIRDAS